MRWPLGAIVLVGVASAHAAEPARELGMSAGMESGKSATMAPMQDGSAPADARDPDAYADGLEPGPMHGMDMVDDQPYGRVFLDRLEATHGREGNGQALDAQASFGGDIDRLWLKLDGARAGGPDGIRLGATRTEALWDHAITPYWGLQTGLRHDFGDGPGRNWAAVGFQGLAPYWFDVQATAYMGTSGRTALRFEPEYDLMITQRLVLQPDVKIDVYGRDDRRRTIGAGLSSTEAGLRLRYEFTRQLAPYVGVVWNGTFGNTARMVRAAGNAAQRTTAVVGARAWF